MHTTKECMLENTITSTSDGLNPFPESTDFGAKSSFNSLRMSTDALEFEGSANVIHLATYKPTWIS